MTNRSILRDAVSRVSQSPEKVLLLGAVLLLALVFRLWGIEYGLPYEGMTYNQLTFEESKEVHRAFKLGIGEYAWTFGKGGMFWILFFEFGVYYVVSLALGLVSDSREFAMQVLEDRTTAYLIGRVTVAFMGVATCAVIFALGRQLYNFRTGVIAALLGSLSYFHAQFSSVINVDIGMVLAMWASVLFFVHYERTNYRPFLVLSGILVGVSVAFKLPGISVVVLLGMAMLFRPGQAFDSSRFLRDGATLGVSMLVALTVVAPEWIPWFGRKFLEIAEVAVASPAYAAAQQSLDEEIWNLTQQRSTWSLGYLYHLIKGHNLALSIVALCGLLWGLWRRDRWVTLFGAFAITFVVVISLSSRPTAERYMLPMLPALWLLGGVMIAHLYQVFRPAMFLLLILTVSAPTYALVRAGFERNGLDTRILAKHWIESNLPSRSKILMDGMQHRFINSPPLNPDESAIERRVGRLERQVGQGKELGRGVNDVTLGFYRESLENTEGPRYDLHSTVHGLALKDPSYYVEECFDYVITSSSIRGRFSPGRLGRIRHPDSANFYDQLDTNRRFQALKSFEARPWETSGPTIIVYQVHHRCVDD